jgi:uncharacterized protein YkwD
MLVYLLPLAAVLILGLIFIGSGLGRSNNATLTFASTPDVSSAAGADAATTSSDPTTGPAAAATGSPSAGRIAGAAVVKGKPKKPKKAKATAKPTRTSSSAPSTSTAPATTKPAAAPTTKAPAPSGGFAEQVLALANTARKDNGCNTPLKLNTKLNTAAQRHSDDMVAKNFFSHTGSDGSDPFQRMTDAGYKWSGAAENIAAGGTTAAGAMDQWMNSPGHKANILNCGLVDLGVGFTKGVNDDYAGYWVQDFGSPL